jgi:beta-aspartyl-peptidase (threonine type)
VVVLEDDPACNAGTGAVLRSDGTVEHDASVMDGLTRTSGALGSLRGYKNPILIAEQVRVDGRYHLLVGDGAATFARDHQALRAGADGRSASMPAVDRGETVGAVALDAAGGIASATSTGGMAGMPPGRVGDTPIVGAGTYASALAACSCTGAGDSFARACTAFWAVDRYRGDAEVTADQALERTLREFGGAGGLILLAADGTYAARRTTDAMPWAAATPDGEPVTGY